MDDPFLGLNLVAISGLAISTTSLFMAGLMFSLGRDAVNHIWGWFCVAVFIWGLSFFYIGSVQDPTAAEWWWRISHIGVIAIPVLFAHFVYRFLALKHRGFLYILYALGALFLLANFFTPWFIDGVRHVFDSFYYDTPGPLYLPFVIFFHAIIVYAHWLLWRAYRTIEDDRRREQIRHFFMATFVGFLGGGISFAPVFGYDIYPHTIITVTLYPLIMGYAILKYRLFDVRVVTAQVIALTIFGFTFIRFLLSTSANDYLLNGLLLLVTIGLGAYLVRSVMKEVDTREQLEIANERLRELDRQKSEFLSIATHQLRGPLSAIRGHLSLLTEGSYGKLPKEAEGIIGKLFRSSGMMAKTITDFLNVSRIEQGRMQYEKETFACDDLVGDVVEELQNSAKEDGLELSFTDNCDGKCQVYGDYAKLRHIFFNLLDNAIKYTEEGSVSATISVDRDARVIRVEVTDTGIGISADEIKTLFQKFVRARDASGINVSGTGLGLYVAREMVEAHGGTIWAESEGRGAGSTFIVELPLAKGEGNEEAASSKADTA